MNVHTIKWDVIGFCEIQCIYEGIINWKVYTSAVSKEQSLEEQDLLEEHAEGC